MLNLEIEILVKSLDKIGFPDRSIKISDYKISSSLDDDKVKKYTASNTLKIQFTLDNKLIDAFYTEIQINKIKDLDVSFETSISDSLEKATRLKLVQMAIEDAKINAVNISKTLSLNLIRIKQVYKENERLTSYANQIDFVKFTPPKIVGDTDLSFKSSFDKFQVDDVQLEEKITLVYEIAK